MAEAAGIKSAIGTGKKPDCGLWMGGVKYNITQYKEEEVNDQTLQVLFCQRPKGGALIAKSKTQIVAGFYDEEKGQNAGNCKRRSQTSPPISLASSTELILHDGNIAHRLCQVQ